MFALFWHFSAGTTGPGVVLGIGGIAVAILVRRTLMQQAKALCNAECVCATRAVGFIGWDGSHQMFELVSATYALAFMLANERKLVNVSPEARQLFEISGHGHKANKPQAAQRHMR